MIFNPLFLSDTGSSQTLTAKTTKLSQNKYLFSDIVKVIMNPLMDQESKSLNKAGNNLAITLANGEMPLEMRLNLLSDLDIELSEKGLIEILPAEISKLLKSEVSDSSEPISFISKDILNGELKDFINNLVGNEVIQNNITYQEGLLLSLEDSESAVNLELSKSLKTSPDNIAVQTIVIPHKGKILSLLNTEEKIEPFFRYKNDKIISLPGADVKNLKPSISLFKYKYQNEGFKSLTKLINSRSLVNQNLSAHLIKKDSIPENLNKIPTGSQKRTELKELKSERSAISQKSQSLLNITEKQDGSAKPTDFDVNKITIVRKITNNNEKDHLTSTKNKNEISTNTKPFEILNFNKSSKNGFIPKQSVNTNVQKIEADLSKDKVSNEMKNSNDSSTLRIEAQKTPNLKFVQTSATASLNNNSKFISKNEIPTNLSRDKHITQTDNTGGEKINIKNELKDAEVKSNSKMNVINVKMKEDIPAEFTDKTKTSVTLPERNGSENTNKKTLPESVKTDMNIKNSDPPKSDKNDQVVRDNNTYTNDKKDLKASNSESSQKNKIENERPNEINSLRNESKQFYEHLNDQSGKVIADTSNSKKNSKEHAKTDLSQKEVRIDTDKLTDYSVKVKGNVTSVTEKSEAFQNPEKNNSENTTRNDGKNQSDDANLDSKSKNNQHIYSQVQSTENHDKMNHVQNKSDLVNPIELGVISKKDEQERPNKILKAVEIVKELSKYILKQEKGSLTFDLKPEHLGQLKITLDTVDKVLKARIEVDNEHAKLMLEKNLDKLHQELNDNGVKLNSLNISLGNYKKQKEERIGRTKNQSQTKDLGQVGESEEENNKKSFGYNTYEYIA